MQAEEKEVGLALDESGAKIAQDLAQLEDDGARSEVRALWGERGEPAYTNKRETYRHRLIAFMLAEGRNHTDIAHQLNVSPVTINYLAKQPFISRQVLELIHQQGDEALAKLHEASLEAAETLIEVMQEAENAETKRKAANDILDRKYGKPNQPYTTKTVPAEQMSDDDLAKVLQN